MPGNGVGDRVHNFFAQDNISQGPRSQVVEGNWPINDNLWVGGQKQFGVSDSSPRNYNPQQSETERGHGSQRVPDPHMFNITQTNARPEFARNMSHHEQPNSNGYMYGRQNFQTRPDEANFLGMDAEYGRNNVNPRGFSFSESQQEPVSEQTPKNPFRSETSSEAHGSFDLFGGQHQINSQYPGQQQQQPQPGFGDIQQLQQQLMFRKMQELQRQELQRQELQRQELQRQEEQRQLEARHQNSLNQVSPFARQASDSTGYGWAEPGSGNTNWLQRAGPPMQGSSSGLAFSPEPGPPQRAMGFVHQQAEPSLYGVPVSSSRGPLNQFPHNNSFPGNQYAATPFGQGSNSGMKMSPQNTSIQESHVAQDLIGPAEIVEDKSASLDPDEEKILFGSDDNNIWDAFGSSKNIGGGGVSSLLDENEFASGLPSIQSGSWSALMQSAVAETTSSGGGGGGSGGGGGLQEEWVDLNFQNPELPSGDINLRNDGAINVGFQNHGKNNPYENDERLNNNFSKQTNQNWLNRGAIQNENSMGRELNPKGISGHWTSQQHGTKQLINKKNNWNANESVPPVNTGFNINENENTIQQSQNSDWKRVNTAAIGNQNNHHLNYWKHVDSSVKSKGSENSEKSQRRLNKGPCPQVSESSFNSSDKEDIKMHEMESSSRRENSNDSYRSTSSHLVGQREKFQSDVDSRTKQSLSNQTGRKTSGQRKFQYHPMGNLDEDAGTPYGIREGINTKSVSLQNSRGLGQDQGHFGHTKISGQGHVTELEGIPKGSDDMRFKGMIPGHVPNIFAPHDRSIGLSTSDKASQPSQNMLELLHKVDQSRDRGIARNLNSLERNLSSEMPEPENSDGSFGGHQKSQSSNSQGIGLQLGPPSQRLPMAMQAVKPNSLTQTQPVANPRGKGRADLSHGEFKNDRISEAAGHTMMTNFPNSRSQFQNSQAVGASSQILTNHSHIKQDETHGRSLSSGLYENAASQPSTGEKLPAYQARANSGVSQQGPFSKMLPNAWSNHPSQQLFSASQARKSQSNFMESTSVGQHKLEANSVDQSAKEPPSLNLSSEKVDQGQTTNGPAGNDPTASQKDLEAFGRSLRPNNYHQHISLMNQMKAIKNIVNDPNIRSLKRPRDSDDLLGGQQVTPIVPPGDSGNVEQNVDSLPATLPLKDVPASAQNMISVKTEQSHINPQMAPSWFDQYGTFKSGQMVSQRADSVKNVGPPVNVGRISGNLETHDSKEQASGAADTNSQSGVIMKTLIPSPVAVEQLSSMPLNTNVGAPNLVNLRTKKRKCSTYELRSWLKEVVGGFKNIQGICNASMEWAGATNRLMEKVDDDGEVIEDVPRPKRRIILVTQLMQQLFPPPPANVLSTDAASNYESLNFHAARLALGDACNLVSSHSGSNPLSDKSRESEKIDDNRLSEVVEECLSKANKLENDFSSLDKKASILDLRVEFQELEKFSIINRFAKFHGRGQTEGEGSSSSDAAAYTPKPFPQRYVIAVPLPKNLPERVQCLSL